jgi:hypothetical protein
MEPTFKLVTKSGFYQYLWLKTVTGFNQDVHCEPCLKGRRSALIPARTGFPAGFIAQGRIEDPAPFVYLCGVSAFSRYYDKHLHILMLPDESSAFTYEDDNVCLLVTGFRKLPISAVPGAEQAVSDEFWTCRNWQAGWHLFPADRKPFVIASQTTRSIP